MGQFVSKNSKSKRNGSTKSTETQMDSIQVKYVTLPGPILMSNVNLGLVNTVFDEKEKLIERYNLDIQAGDCQLILWVNNKDTIMEDNLLIEVFKDELISSFTRVELRHTAVLKEAVKLLYKLSCSLVAAYFEINHTKFGIFKHFLEK